MVRLPHKSAALHIINNKLDDTYVKKNNVLHGYTPSIAMNESVRFGSTITSPLKLTITDYWKGAWERSFLTTNPFATSHIEMSMLKGSTISFLMLNLLALSMSVSTFNENARVHLGSYNAVQLLPVHVNDTLRNKNDIDDAIHKTKCSNEMQYTIVNSTHKLINQRNEVVFSVVSAPCFH